MSSFPLSSHSSFASLTPSSSLLPPTTITTTTTSISSSSSSSAPPFPPSPSSIFASSSSASQMADFSSAFLFSLGFTERLVKPKRSLDLRNLLKNLITLSKLSFSTLVLALRYMEGYAQSDPANLQYSVYPVFVTAIMAASKFLEDSTFTNKSWASITGFRLAELNGLEMHFLGALRFKLFVSEVEYTSWLARLLKFIQSLQTQRLEEERRLHAAPPSLLLTPSPEQSPMPLSSSPTSPLAPLSLPLPSLQLQRPLLHPSSHHPYLSYPSASSSSSSSSSIPPSTAAAAAPSQQRLHYQQQLASHPIHSLCPPPLSSSSSSSSSLPSISSILPFSPGPVQQTFPSFPLPPALQAYPSHYSSQTILPSSAALSLSLSLPLTTQPTALEAPLSVKRPLDAQQQEAHPSKRSRNDPSHPLTSSSSTPPPGVAFPSKQPPALRSKPKKKGI